MNALLVFVATTAMGIEVGWEPLPGGGHEYTIQIEPQLLSILETGEDEIFSEVPAGIDVRRYRILVGTGKLRRDSAPLQPTAADPPLASAPAAREPTSRLTQPDLGAAAAAANPPAASAESWQQPAQETPDRFASPSAAQPQEPLDDIPPPAANDRYGTPPATTPAAGDDLELPAADIPAAEMPELPPAGESAPATEPGTTPAQPRDPWADYESASQSDSAAKGRTETLILGADAGKSDAGQAPAKLPSDTGSSGLIKQTTLETAAASPSDLQEHEAAKPKLDGNPPNEPWFPLIAAIVLLGCSVGGNIYLGWIALDARARYRSVVAKFRGAPA